MEKAVSYLRKCRNFDGGFGNSEGAESHSSQGIIKIMHLLIVILTVTASRKVWTCVAALAILDRLDDEVDQELLGWWLTERQLPNGGLNGRPEKLEDVSDSLGWGISWR